MKLRVSVTNINIFVASTSYQSRGPTRRSSSTGRHQVSGRVDVAKPTTCGFPSNAEIGDAVIHPDRLKYARLIF